MIDLVSECRLELLSNKIGLTTNDQLISWADSKLQELDTPPNYLIDVSMGELPLDPPAVDIVRNDIEKAECAELIKRIGTRREKGDILLFH